MINRRPACVHMELDQQCTDICSKAGFLWQPPPQKVLVFSIFISVSVSLQSCLYLIFRLLPQLFMHIHHIIDQDPSLFLNLSTLLDITLFFLLTTHRTFCPSHRLSTYLPPLPYFPPPPSPHSVTLPTTLPTPSPTTLLLIPPTLRPAIYIGHGCSPFWV